MKTTFERKPDFRFREFEMEKSVTISGERFEELLRAPCRDQAFIADSKDQMYQDGKGVYHCLLVTGEGRPDGVLVESEGSAYARYVAYVPEATALRYPSLSKMNQELAAAVDFIVADGTGQTTEGNWILSFAELEEKTGLCVDGKPFLQEMLGDMLCDRPEVADLTIEDGCFDVAYHTGFCQNCAPEESPVMSPEMKL